MTNEAAEVLWLSPVSGVMRPVLPIFADRIRERARAGRPLPTANGTARVSLGWLAPKQRLGNVQEQSREGGVIPMGRGRSSSAH